MKVRVWTACEDGSDEFCNEYELDLRPDTKEAAWTYFTAQIDETNRYDASRRFQGPKRVLLNLEIFPELQAPKRRATG